MNKIYFNQVEHDNGHKVLTGEYNTSCSLSETEKYHFHIIVHGENFFQYGQKDKSFKYVMWIDLYKGSYGDPDRHKVREFQEGLFDMPEQSEDMIDGLVQKRLEMVKEAWNFNEV